MGSNLPYAVVIDIDHINGLQTARIFHFRKIKVIGIANNVSHYCAKTRACTRIINSSTKTNELIDTLLMLGTEFEQKPLLIPSQDTSVLLVSRNRDILTPLYHIALPSEAAVEMLMDKPSFYTYARKMNLPIARYYLIKTRSEAEQAIESLNPPLIIKPPLKSPRWEANTKIKAYKVNNREDFLKIYEMCKNWADVLMVQEWIEGTDVDLYSCNCYFNEQNKPLVSFISKKLRQYPPVTGNTSLGIECRADEVKNISLDLFKRVGFHGLGYLEIKRDARTGKHYIIEPNIGRPTGRSALAEAAGVEILYTMYCDKMGLPLPDQVEQKYLGIKWVHIRTDLMSAYYYWKNHELTLRNWLKSLTGRKFYAVYSLKDPLPFLAEIYTGIKIIFEALIFRLFKTNSKQSAPLKGFVKQ